MPRPLKVFISHAHADATRVRTLHNRLVADGVDSCLYKEKLIPNQSTLVGFVYVARWIYPRAIPKRKRISSLV